LSAEIWKKLVVDLRANGVNVLNPESLNITELNYFGAFLAEKVVPKADLMDQEMLRDAASGSLYLAAGDEKRIKHFLRVPDVPRLLEVPSRPMSFIRTGQLIRLRRDLFLPKAMPIYEFRITRLAGGEFGKVDWEELPSALEQRTAGFVSRLEMESDFPLPWTEQLQKVFKLEPQEIFRVPPPLDFSFLFKFIESASRADLVFTPINPRKYPPFLRDPFGYLDAQDLLLYHPTDDFAAVERFVQAAAIDPAVDLIRITGYRIGRKSAIADGLCEAAKRGKNVAVLLEGRARFDELQNLYWRLHFESSGVHILPLVSGYKVHAKLLLIRHSGKYYAHLGTGNYNSANAKLYTDISYLTTNPALCEDLDSFFKSMENGELPTLKTLLSGSKMREAFLGKIARESNPQGHIIIKVNHLTDEPILTALRNAADAGAKIELIVRSTLTLLYSKFFMKSIVGRFLEHSRIASFRNGGNWEVFAGSADWMTRNFDSRVEVMFPLPGDLKQKVLNLLIRQTRDDRNGFMLLADGTQTTQWSGRNDAQLSRL
jgi:polyphosphate kinase